MAFFNPRVPALMLLSLSIALSAAAADPATELAQDAQYLKARMPPAVNQVELFLANVAAKWLSDAAAAEKCPCAAVCHEMYGNAAANMKKGLEDAAEGYLASTNELVTQFYAHVDTCNDCFVESGGAEGGCAAEFRKFDGWAKGVALDFFARTAKYGNTEI